MSFLCVTDLSSRHSLASEGLAGQCPHARYYRGMDKLPDPLPPRLRMLCINTKQAPAIKWAAEQIARREGLSRHAVLLLALQQGLDALA